LQRTAFFALQHVNKCVNVTSDTVWNCPSINTRKGGNCDALQRKAARLRSSHSGLLLTNFLLQLNSATLIS